MCGVILNANQTATYPAGQFMQCNSNGKWRSRISDFVFIPDVNIADSQFQVFNDISKKFLCKRVLFCIFCNI